MFSELRRAVDPAAMQELYVTLVSICEAKAAKHKAAQDGSSSESVSLRLNEAISRLGRLLQETKVGW